MSDLVLPLRTGGVSLLFEIRPHEGSPRCNPVTSRGAASTSYPRHVTSICEEMQMELHYLEQGPAAWELQIKRRWYPSELEMFPFQRLGVGTHPILTGRVISGMVLSSRP